MERNKSPNDSDDVTEEEILAQVLVQEDSYDIDNADDKPILNEEYNNNGEEIRFDIGDTEDGTYLTALRVVELWNKEHPLEGEDLKTAFRFKINIREMITRLSLQARSVDHGWWLALLPEDREMSRFFRGVLLKADPDVLTNNMLSRTPMTSQKVFGKPDLQPLDLLQLPIIPEKFPYSLTYTNIAVQVGIDNIVKKPSFFCTKPELVKASSVRYTPEMPVGVYIGSSVDRRGGWARLATHEAEANSESGLNNLHYNFTRQEDAVPNFRLIGMWDNPEFHSEAETTKYMAAFYEAVMQAYVRLYHPSLRSVRNHHVDHIFPPGSYELVEYLRMELILPDFSFCSLNRAWSLVQGFQHIMYGTCGNGDCKGGAPTKKLYFPDGIFKPGICTECKKVRRNKRAREIFAALPQEQKDIFRAKARVWSKQSRDRLAAQRTEEEEREFREKKRRKDRDSYKRVKARMTEGEHDAKLLKGREHMASFKAALAPDKLEEFRAKDRARTKRNLEKAQATMTDERREELLARRRELTNTRRREESAKKRKAGEISAGAEVWDESVEATSGEESPDEDGHESESLIVDDSEDGDGDESPNVGTEESPNLAASSARPLLLVESQTRGSSPSSSDSHGDSTDEEDEPEPLVEASADAMHIDKPVSVWGDNRVMTFTGHDTPSIARVRLMPGGGIMHVEDHGDTTDEEDEPEALVEASADARHIDKPVSVWSDNRIMTFAGHDTPSIARVRLMPGGGIMTIEGHD